MGRARTSSDPGQHCTRREAARRGAAHSQARALTLSQKRIAAAVARRSLSTLRRHEYQKFLDASNAKAGLFLDAIVGDYDPTVLNRSLPRARVGSLPDPLKRAMRKHDAETLLLHPGRTVSSLGRATLDPQLWQARRLSSPPNTKLTATASAPSSHPAAQQSSITFDHFFGTSRTRTHSVEPPGSA